MGGALREVVCYLVTDHHISRTVYKRTFHHMGEIIAGNLTYACRKIQYHTFAVSTCE